MAVTRRVVVRGWMLVALTVAVVLTALALGPAITSGAEPHAPSPSHPPAQIGAAGALTGAIGAPLPDPALMRSLREQEAEAAEQAASGETT